MDHWSCFKNLHPKSTAKPNKTKFTRGSASGKVTRELVVFIWTGATSATTVPPVKATVPPPPPPMERVKILELNALGAAGDGSLLERVRVLESSVLGAPGTGSLNERMTRVELGLGL